MQNTLKEAEKADQFQRFGELLTANLYAAKKGMKEIEVLDGVAQDQVPDTSPRQKEP